MALLCVAHIPRGLLCSTVDLVRHIYGRASSEGQPFYRYSSFCSTFLQTLYRTTWARLLSHTQRSMVSPCVWTIPHWCSVLSMQLFTETCWSPAHHSQTMTTVLPWERTKFSVIIVQQIIKFHVDGTSTLYYRSGFHLFSGRRFRELGFGTARTCTTCLQGWDQNTGAAQKR